jgi:aspartyl/asparaginyl beta-hydroxylase (cupin superfamily)
MIDYILKDEEINISEKTQLNCNFDKGYNYIHNYNTYNVNDINGRNIIISLILIIILSVYIFNSDKFNYENFHLSEHIELAIYILFIIVVLLAISIIKNPVQIIYIFSYFIKLDTRTPPYLDIDKYFPNHIKLEAPEVFAKIQKETLNILKQKDKLVLTKNTLGNNYIGGGNIQSNNDDGWKIYMVKIGTTNFAEDTMPVLTKILKEIPEVVSCAVSILPAKKAIPIHIGYSKGVIRYQLAMKVPKDRENVFICVNGEKYNWTEGEGVLFDDTYPHKVFNNTDEDRVVLYIDIVRPFLNPALDLINRLSIKLITNSSITKDEIAKTEKQIDID